LVPSVGVEFYDVGQVHLLILGPCVGGVEPVFRPAELAGCLWCGLAGRPSGAVALGGAKDGYIGR